MFRRFREAGYDIERAYEKQGLPSPSFYPEAKQEAVAMARAGEARFRPERARK
jgi:hypothetical protein